MKKNILVYVLVSFLLGAVSIAYGRDAELRDPDAIAPPQGFTIDRLDKIVDLSLAQQHWRKTKNINETPRTIEVEYSIRAHTIVMRIEYDLSSIQLSYVDSENLNYKKKKNISYIHPKYMQWTQRLANQIQSNFGLTEDVLTSASAFKSSMLGATAVSNSNPSIPREMFSHFSAFKLEATTINPKFQGNAGNEKTTINLDHNLNLTLKPKLDYWGKNDGAQRALIIKPHVAAVRFIPSGARVWGGRMAGRSWIYVKAQFVDEASNQVVAEPEFYRIADAANGFTLTRVDYKMVEDMAKDITSYVQNNYSTVVGGGNAPPINIKSEL